MYIVTVNEPGYMPFLSYECETLEEARSYLANEIERTHDQADSVTTEDNLKLALLDVSLGATVIVFGGLAHCLSEATE